ncbi:MAG: hypothetical protein WBG18_18750 [Xanthobacteraceae bacterium]
MRDRGAGRKNWSNTFTAQRVAVRIWQTMNGPLDTWGEQSRFRQ